MKMRYSMVLAVLLVLVNHAFLSLGLAGPQPRAAGETSKITEAVFLLSEQTKKEGLIDIKNHFQDVQEMSKPLPIEPTLGKEIQPDLVETK